VPSELILILKRGIFIPKEPNRFSKEAFFFGTHCLLQGQIEKGFVILSVVFPPTSLSRRRKCRGVYVFTSRN
jgi:hypothetical protein